MAEAFAYSAGNTQTLYIVVVGGCDCVQRADKVNGIYMQELLRLKTKEEYLSLLKNMLSVNFKAAIVGHRQRPQATIRTNARNSRLGNFDASKALLRKHPRHLGRVETHKVVKCRTDL